MCTTIARSMLTTELGSGFGSMHMVTNKTGTRSQVFLARLFEEHGELLQYPGVSVSVSVKMFK